jgi:hypothetical protein
MDNLLRDGGFQAAFAAAAVLAVSAWALRRVVVLEWALVAVAASLVGLAVEHMVDPTLTWALVLLGAGGALGARAPFVAQGALVVPGAVVLVQAVTPVATTWMRVAAVVVLAVMAPLVRWPGERLVRVTPWLLFATTVGVYVCVPETGQAHSVLAAFIPAVLLSSVLVRVPHAAFLFPLVGLVVWVTVTGGAFRPGSVVGGLACFGVLALPAVTVRTPAWLTLAVQGALVLFVARVAGFRVGAGEALALVLVGFAGALAVLVVGAAAQRRAASSR